MDKIVLYGTGKTFREALPVLQRSFEVEAVIDRNSDLWGRKFGEIPIIELGQYISEESYRDCKLVITVNDSNMWQVKEKLRERGVTEYTTYHELLYGEKVRERIFSCCFPHEAEDIILHHVFRDFEDIYYIDVGSNDPTIGSVTKLLYETKNAHGINIEPLQEYAEITNLERKRDVNLSLGLGEREGVSSFYVPQDMDACSSLDSGVLSGTRTGGVRQIQITTLENICNQYVPDGQEISLLKIDVEGAEKRVLQGANFKKYRPMVIIVEDNDVSYGAWEDILIEAQYHFTFSYGVNRYYVADECAALDARFRPIDELKLRYNVRSLFWQES